MQDEQRFVGTFVQGDAPYQWALLTDDGKYQVSSMSVSQYNNMPRGVGFGDIVEVIGELEGDLIVASTIHPDPRGGTSTE